jgi:hypothetical protein
MNQAYYLFFQWHIPFGLQPQSGFEFYRSTGALLCQAPVDEVSDLRPLFLYFLILPLIRKWRFTAFSLYRDYMLFQH